MGTDETTAIRIGLHDVARLRWPREPICGDGPRQDVSVPLPRLPWSRAAVQVPLGAGAERGVARVLTLRRIFGYGVAPLIVALFVVADVLLLGARYGSLHPPGPLFAVFGVAGVLLVLSGLLPDVVARLTGTPYVSRNQLRIPAARVAVARQLAKLNPQVEIAGLALGDMPSRR